MGSPVVAGEQAAEHVLLTGATGCRLTLLLGVDHASSNRARRTEPPPRRDCTTGDFKKAPFAGTPPGQHGVVKDGLFRMTLGNKPDRRVT
jgi:hypothetical protein